MTALGMTKTNIANGYQFVYAPQTALTDGEHTVTINVSDHDGNAAATYTFKFKVDTVPPTLTITAPTNNLITNKKALTLTGKTNDATSSPVIVTATLNGKSIGAITVGTDGAFTKAITANRGQQYTGCYRKGFCRQGYHGNGYIQGRYICACCEECDNYTESGKCKRKCSDCSGNRIRQVVDYGVHCHLRTKKYRLCGWYGKRYRHCVSQKSG